MNKRLCAPIEGRKAGKEMREGTWFVLDFTPIAYSLCFPLSVELRRENFQFSCKVKLFLYSAQTRNIVET